MPIPRRAGPTSRTAGRMRVLGVDCGTASTGYGVIEQAGPAAGPAKGGAGGAGDRCRMLACGAIRTPSSWELPRRLEKIHRELKILAERFAPQAMAIEAVFTAANVRSALKLAQVRGVALLAAAQTGLSVSEYSALEVKRGVVGYGRAEKRQVQQMVRQLLQLETIPQSDDAADALAVAICHLHTSSTREKIAASVHDERFAHGGRVRRAAPSTPPIGLRPQGRRLRASAAGGSRQSDGGSH